MSGASLRLAGLSLGAKPSQEVVDPDTLKKDISRGFNRAVTFVSLFYYVLLKIKNVPQ